MPSSCDAQKRLNQTIRPKSTLLTTVITFRIVYSSSNRAWVAGFQHWQRISPYVYHSFYPMAALFFRFDARTGLASGKVTNKLPIDFLESYVQTVLTAERGAFASSASISLNSSATSS